MWRGFLSLYGAVVLALLISFFLLYLPLSWYVQKIVHQEVNQITSGIFKLIEAEFAAQGPAKTDAVLARMNSLFPYGMALISQEATETLDFSSTARKMLNSGKIAHLDGDPEALYKKLPGSNKILQFNWDASFQTDTELQANGVLRLLESRLAQVPKAQWPEKSAEIIQWFDIPITFETADNIHLEKHELAIINQGRLYSRKIEDNQYVVFGRIADSDTILKAGPMNHELNFGGNYLLLIPVVLTAIPVFVWFSLLWRDVKQLNSATAKLGNGELSTRTKIMQRSALKETAIRFNQMAADIEQLIRDNRELTNAISHDLKTPLSRMRFALEMLADQELSAKSKRLTHSLEDDVMELEILVEELLANARYDRQLELHCEPISDLTKWVERIARHRHLQNPEIFLSFENTGNPQRNPIHIDQKAMARALGNIIGNALTYANQKVHCNVNIQKKHCAIAISDDGPGISIHDRNRVLKPFIRLEQSRATKGHGLGLAISARILQQHEGGISINDSPLGGAEVVLRWPV